MFLINSGKTCFEKHNVCAALGSTQKLLY